MTAVIVIAVIVGILIIVFVGALVGGYVIFRLSRTGQPLAPEVDFFRISDTHLCPSPDCHVVVEYRIRRSPGDATSRVTLKVTKVSDGDSATSVTLVGPDADSFEDSRTLSSNHPVFSGPGTYRFRLSVSNSPEPAPADEIRVLQLVETDQNGEFAVALTMNAEAPLAPVDSRTNLVHHTAMSNLQFVGMTVDGEKRTVDSVVRITCKDVRLKGITLDEAVLVPMDVNEVAAVVNQNNSDDPPNDFLVGGQDAPVDHPIRILPSVWVGEPPVERTFPEEEIALGDRLDLDDGLLLSDQLLLRTAWQNTPIIPFFPKRKAQWRITCHFRCPSEAG